MAPVGGLMRVPNVMTVHPSVPAKTPSEVIATLNKAITEVLADPKMKARLAELGGTEMGGTPADFGKIVASETEKWRKVVEFSGASVE